MVDDVIPGYCDPLIVLGLSVLRFPRTHPPQPFLHPAEGRQQGLLAREAAVMQLEGAGKNERDAERSGAGLRLGHRLWDKALGTCAGSELSLG